MDDEEFGANLNCVFIFFNVLNSLNEKMNYNNLKYQYESGK